MFLGIKGHLLMVGSLDMASANGLMGQYIKGNGKII